MIEATVTQKVALLRTRDQFVIAIGDKIHGPFKVANAHKLIGALEEFDNEKWQTSNKKPNESSTVRRPKSY